MMNTKENIKSLKGTNTTKSHVLHPSPQDRNGSMSTLINMFTSSLINCAIISKSRICNIAKKILPWWQLSIQSDEISVSIISEIWMSICIAKQSIFKYDPRNNILMEIKDNRATLTNRLRNKMLITMVVSMTDQIWTLPTLVLTMPQ